MSITKKTIQNLSMSMGIIASLFLFHSSVGFTQSHIDAESMMRETQLVAKVGLQLQRIKSGFIEASNKTDYLNEMMLAIINNEVSKEFGLSQSRKLAVELKLMLDTADRELEQFSIPKIRTDKWKNVLRANYLHLYEIKKGVREAFKEAVSSYKKLRNGVYLDALDIEKQTLKNLILLVEMDLKGTEVMNMSMELKPNHPEFYYIQIILTLQRYQLEILHNMKNFYDNNFTQKEVLSRIHATSSKLSSQIDYLVVEGQRYVNQAIAKAEQIRRSAPRKMSDRGRKVLKWFEGIANGMEVYREIFVNERKIATLLYDWGLSLGHISNLGDALKSTERFSLKSLILEKTRERLVLKRTKIMGGLARQ